jgi:hypothetical protein
LNRQGGELSLGEDEWKSKMAELLIDFYGFFSIFLAVAW